GKKEKEKVMPTQSNENLLKEQQTFIDEVIGDKISDSDFKKEALSVDDNLSKDLQDVKEQKDTLLPVKASSDSGIQEQISSELHKTNDDVEFKCSEADVIPKVDKLSNVGVEEKKDSVPTEETTPLIDENSTIALESTKEPSLDSEAKKKLIDATIEPSIDTSEKDEKKEKEKVIPTQSNEIIVVSDSTEVSLEDQPMLTNEIVESGLDNQKKKEIPSEESNISKEHEAINEQKDMSNIQGVKKKDSVPTEEVSNDETKNLELSTDKPILTNDVSQEMQPDLIECASLSDENSTIALESTKEPSLDSEAKDKLLDDNIKPSIDTSKNDEKKEKEKVMPIKRNEIQFDSDNTEVLLEDQPKLTDEIVDSGLDNQKRKDISSVDGTITKEHEAIIEQKDIPLKIQTTSECVIQEPTSSELDISDRTIERKPDDDLIIPKEDELSNIEGVKKKDSVPTEEISNDETKNLELSKDKPLITSDISQEMKPDLIDENKTVALESEKESPLDSVSKVDEMISLEQLSNVPKDKLLE
uniref:Microtubule-associated protein futsch n=1 Tax=Parastrongyloides trichosuri TaxID=131310 RepID=A0A0N4ZZK7_PARTI